MTKNKHEIKAMKRQVDTVSWLFYIDGNINYGCGANRAFIILKGEHHGKKRNIETDPHE